MEHLVNIFPKPCPPYTRPGHEAKASALLKTWNSAIGGREVNHEADYEDFYEQAARLHAAIEGFGPENVWLRYMRRPFADYAKNLATGKKKPADELEHLPRYGAQPGGIHDRVTDEQEQLAGNYHQAEAFGRLAGRKLALGGFGTGDDGDAARIITGMMSEGVTDFFIKGTRTKSGIWQVSPKPGSTPTEIDLDIIASDGSYGLMMLEGRPGTMLIQERVEMTFEYRLFIVHGRVVTGAGCIEEFTPLDNRGAAFDTRVQRHRNKSAVMDDQERVYGLLDFAEGAVAAFAAEVPELHTYVMDLAFGPDQKPLVIELNGMLNSGLYATDPLAVTRALAAAAADGGTVFAAA